jgi:cellulose synthase/poly-beta-1,6-N-acetylglucosamine synthase-like glycosyltransferase
MLLLYLLFGFLAFVTLYLFVFAVAGLFRKPLPGVPVGGGLFRRMVVLLPAYREDAVIVDSARQALGQQYPADRYDVVVIADSLRADTLARLRELPLRVVEVRFESSTKAKALNAALAELGEGYDVAVVLDADNVLAPDFLNQVNAAFGRGWRVVQGHRTAKNTNTPTAVLDAVSEEVNNLIFRQGHRALGLASALIGSGMAFEYGLFKGLMAQIHTTGGFDKELEMRLLSQGLSAEYLPEAYCYDEKVQNPEVFEKQRSRWLAAQVKYFRQNGWPGLKALFRGNVNYADKVFQTVLPPRVMLLGLLGLGTGLALLLTDGVLLALAGGSLALLLLTFYLATPPALKAKLTWRELRQVPGLLFRFVRSFRKIGEAQKRFIHTPHDTTTSS